VVYQFLSIQLFIKGLPLHSRPYLPTHPPSTPPLSNDDETTAIETSTPHQKDLSCLREYLPSPGATQLDRNVKAFTKLSQHSLTATFSSCSFYSSSLPPSSPQPPHRQQLLHRRYPPQNLTNIRVSPPSPHQLFYLFQNTGKKRKMKMKKLTKHSSIISSLIPFLGPFPFRKRNRLRHITRLCQFTARRR
jgi:hypothetical protein